MRIRLMVLLCAVVGLVGVDLPALADVAPAASDLELPTAPVVLYATVGSSLSISVVAVPGTNPIASVVADFSAQVPRTPTSAWTDAISHVPMTTTNGTLYTLTVPIPRNASPGPWTVRVTVTDDHGEQGTNAAAVNVVQNTHLSLHYSPAVPRDIGIVTFTGKLTSMQPATTDPATADGSYVPYPSKTFTLELAGEDFQFTTDGAGGYRFATTFASTFVASAAFAGTIYRAPATSGPITITMVRDATRIIDFKVSPNPMYRNAFVTVSGTLQENDPNGPDWLPYLVRRTVVLVRDSPVHYQTTVRTSRGGHFSLTLHGTTAAIAGIWYASVPGTDYHAPSFSALYPVSTMTAPMRITKVEFNPPGVDDPPTPSQLNEEYVTITDEGDHDANLFDWTLRDRAGHIYTIDHSVYVQPGHSITLHTGTGIDTDTQLYWSQDTYIWNNDGDTAYLRNDRNEAVDNCAWTGTGSSTDC